MPTTLLDQHGRFLDVDLLDHSGFAPKRGLRTMAVPRAKVKAMIEEPSVYEFGRERITFVIGVSWLATDGTPVLAFGERWLGWLDDVRRGGLEDVAESLQAAASSSWSRVTAAVSAASRTCWASNFTSWASNFACKRRQFGQDFHALALMAGYATSLTRNTQHW